MGESGFSDRELDVMSILWRRGSGTVAEVREELGASLAYTSVLSALQALEAKGHIRHEKEGKVYRYVPEVPREEAGRNAIGRLLDKVFDGSAARMLAQLVEERGVSPEELARMRALLDERLREEGRS